MSERTGIVEGGEELPCGKVGGQVARCHILPIHLLNSTKAKTIINSE